MGTRVLINISFEETMPQKISKTDSDRSPPLYVQYAIEILESSKRDKVPFVDSTGSIKQLVLLQTESVVNALFEAKRALKSNDKATLIQFLKNKQHIIAVDGKKNYTVGDLAKPSQTKIELGYLAEAILQCAITARLVERTRSVTSAIIERYVEDFLDSKQVWMLGKQTKTIARQMEYQAENRDINAKDVVISYISLNAKGFNFLSNNKFRLAQNIYLKPLFDDAVSYVNSGAPAQHAQYFYTNGLVDKLTITSLGVIGQKSTKTDIITEYFEGYDPSRPGSGKPVEFKLNLSVKINNTKQFGQASGIYLEAMERLASAVGVTLSEKTKKDIQTLVPTRMFGNQIRTISSAEEIKAKKIHEHVYALVYNDIQDQLNNKTGKIESFFDGIEYFLSMKDPSIVVVNIGGGDRLYYADRFNDLKQRFKRDKIITKLVAQTSGNYQMDFYISSDKKDVLRLESRPIGSTFRSYVLSGEALRMWLSDIGTK